MARRRRAPVQVSLFSFQDIIVCTSGVIIFFVLVLILEQIHQVERVSARARQPDQPGAPAPVELEAIQAQIQGARDFLYYDFEGRLASLRATERALTDASERLAGEEARDAGVRTAREELLDEEAQSLRRRAQEVRRQRQELRGTLEEYRSETRVRYLPPEGTDRAPILVLCTAEGVWVAPPGATSTRKGTLIRRGSNVAGGLKAALGGASPDRYFLLFLIKPGAAAFMDEALKGVSELGYGLGLAPLEPEVDVVVLGGEGE